MKSPKFLVPIILLSAASAAHASVFPYIVKQGLFQGSLLLRAKKITEVLKRDDLDPRTERYLRLSLDVLKFAKEQLGMKMGSSYLKYVDIRRPWVTQVVTAAYRDRLELRLFKFPVVGALPYKGFFQEDDAKDEENELNSAGFDVDRREVDAYSTIGYLPDPVISTMFSNEGRFIELLFHELTHLNFYFEGQGDFNEAFATWMGLNCTLQFLDTHPSTVSDVKQIREEVLKNDKYQRSLTTKIQEILTYGKDFYKKPDAVKKRDEYFSWIRSTLTKEGGLERAAKWKWNNALILSLGTYYQLIPTIEKYAASHKLGPKEFLALIVSGGEKMASEITNTK